MFFRKLFTGSVSICTAGLLAGGAFAGDLSSGKQKVEAVCHTCHGIDGIGNIAGVPNLSGQKEDYIKIQLEAYRAGKRQHIQMSTIAQALTDEEIRNVAKWYSSITITVTMPE